jgi:hypothetical protein
VKSFFCCEKRAEISAEAMKTAIEEYLEEYNQASERIHENFRQFPLENPAIIDK